MAVQAFDLAERLQTPVFVMLDLDIGMNDWMSPEFKWDDAWRPDRGKMLTPEQIAGIEKFQRYLDPDGDGIPYRTLPGISPKAAYFTRGSGHSRFGAYTEDSAEYQDVLDRLTRKFATAAKHVPPAVIDGRGATTAIVSLGSCDAPVREALATLRRSGVAVDYMRVRGFPFGADVEEFLAAHQTIFVVEQNRDAQLRALLTLETAVDKKKLRSILHYNGLSMTAGFVVDDDRQGARPGGGGMSFIAKPKVANPGLPRNDLGLNRRDYEGSMSTLCAGCGHDSVTAAIVQACFELSMPPQSVVKLSGIGCSSKTTAYFVAGAHGFNAVHGRMPSIATGANAANRHLRYIGVSGDGDSLSIGVGQLAHAIRRNLDMVYILENNGVYGLTKGQFSASADVGSKSKKGEANEQQPIDPVLFALALGASFVARSFSGDKEQLVPLIQAGLAHKGFAIIDVLSPCVTFNDHEGSTKSYAYVREHTETPVAADYIAPRQEIRVQYAPGETVSVPMHDGSNVLLRKLDPGYDPTDRARAAAYVQERAMKNEYVTGLIYVDTSRRDFHAQHATSESALNAVPFERLCPGSAKLDKILAHSAETARSRWTRRLRPTSRVAGLQSSAFSAPGRIVSVTGVVPCSWPSSSTRQGGSLAIVASRQRTT